MTTMTPLQMLKTIGANKSFYFRLAIRAVRDAICTHEKLHENPVFDSDGSDLHGLVCGRQASRLQEERQELPDERQQRMQMREELRLHY
jgi:hypothetical protein